MYQGKVMNYAEELEVRAHPPIGLCIERAMVCVQCPGHAYCRFRWSMGAGPFSTRVLMGHWLFAERVD